LEGAGGDIPGWGWTIDALAGRCRVVALDFRGNGRSDAPDERMRMGVFVDDAVALLDELRVESAHAYGQSFGGMVAQDLALDHPDRVRSLILAATHPGRRHMVRTTYRVPKDRPYLALFSESFARHHPERVTEHQRVAQDNPSPPHAGTRQWEAMLAFDAYDRLPEIRVPTLVLHGTDDRLIPVANAKLLVGRIPHAELVMLAGAGHVYHWEQPEAAAHAVLAFVERVEAAVSRR